MKKRILALLLAFSLYPVSLGNAAPSPSPSTSATATQTETQEEEKRTAEDFPESTAEGVVLMERNTGKILYEKNKAQKLYPASTTKIMTGILALEKGNLADTVIASKEAIAPITNKHSHMGILVGEELTMNDLVHGLLVYSANDAANVIGVHIAGSLEAFVEMMNQKAQELGMTNTHFANTHGFHDDNHYTTPEDMATLARYAMENPTFAEIVKTDMYTMAPTNKYKEDRFLSSTNHLVSRRRNGKYFYKYATGIKTGFTDEAGNCLVSSAQKDGVDLICVVMKADHTDGEAHSFTDSKALFDHVFDFYHYCPVAVNGEIEADSVVYEAKDQIRVTLTPKDNVDKLLPKTVTKDVLNKEVTLAEKIEAPIAKGDVLGEIVYSYQGEELARTELIASNDVEKDYILAAIHIAVKIVTSPILWICIILLLFVRYRVIKARKKRRRRQRSRQRYNG